MVQSEYGLNEHLFEFLRERGWWERLTAFRPALKKANGKDPRALNGAWVMVNGPVPIGRSQKAIYA